MKTFNYHYDNSVTGVRMAERLSAWAMDRIGHLGRAIVETHPGMFEQLRPSLGQFTLTDEISRFNLYAISGPPERILSLARLPSVRRIYPDLQMTAILPPNFFQLSTFRPIGMVRGIITGRPGGILGLTAPRRDNPIKGPEDTNAALGVGGPFDGSGVKIGVVDTGCWQVHRSRSLRGVVLIDVNTPFAVNAMRDNNGHGTHCTYIVVTTAPGAEVAHTRGLLTPVGTGTQSRIIKAIAALADWGAKVISLSLGSEDTNRPPQDDAYFPVTQQLLAQGIIIVAAAGNSGPNPKTMNSPADMPGVIAVGSWADTYQTVAWFSSRGPTFDGRDGVTVLSLGGGGPEDQPDELIHGATRPGSPCDLFGKGASAWADLMGTSQAAPKAAGIIGRWVQQLRSQGRPDGPTDIMNIIKSGRRSNPVHGFGLLRQDWL